jgi:predicted DNA-binding protein
MTTSLKLKKETTQRLKQVADQTGIPEADIIDRALDVYLITEELGGLKELTEDINFWQERYLDTLTLDENRLARLDHEEGRNLGQ